MKCAETQPALAGNESERPAVSDWASALSWGSETELVIKLQAGSETAFDWLVTHYHAAVYNLILGMLGDASDAADGTQEVFLKAFRGIGGFRHGSSLKTWLYRIAIREALNHQRWFKRHLQKNVSIDAEPEEGHNHIDVEDLAETPFEQLASREIQTAVHSALHKIPGVFRVAVILRDLEGLSYEEVAEVLDCSVGTVKSRILRGRRALKEILEPILGEHGNRRHATSVSHDSALTQKVAAGRNRASSSAHRSAQPSPFTDAYSAGRRITALSQKMLPADSPSEGLPRNALKFTRSWPAIWMASSRAARARRSVCRFVSIWRAAPPAVKSCSVSGSWLSCSLACPDTRHRHIWL
jgi:RNA polymerase sigma-70 factor (ECF subfamily)